MILANTNIEIVEQSVGNANVIVTWANNANVLAFGLANGVSAVIDYSGYFQRVAAAVETIAINTTIMANNSNTMLAYASSINTSLSQITSNTEIIANSANVLSNLANSIGIMTRNSYDSLYAVTTYQYLIEQGNALDTTDVVDDDTQQLAKDKVTGYKSKIQGIL